MGRSNVHAILDRAGKGLKRRPWLWPGIPWLVVGFLPFVIGLLAPRVPLLFAMLPVTVPYVTEGDVKVLLLLGGWGASYIAAAFGILLRRLFAPEVGAH